MFVELNKYDFLKTIACNIGIKYSIEDSKVNLRKSLRKYKKRYGCGKIEEKRKSETQID